MPTTIHLTQPNNTTVVLQSHNRFNIHHIYSFTPFVCRYHSSPSRFHTYSIRFTVFPSASTPSAISRSCILRFSISYIFPSHISHTLLSIHVIRLSNSLLYLQSSYHCRFHSNSWCRSSCINLYPSFITELVHYASNIQS